MSQLASRERTFYGILTWLALKLCSKSHCSVAPNFWFLQQSIFSLFRFPFSAHPPISLFVLSHASVPLSSTCFSIFFSLHHLCSFPPFFIPSLIELIDLIDFNIPHLSPPLIPLTPPLGTPLPLRARVIPAFDLPKKIFKLFFVPTESCLARCGSVRMFN